MVNQHVILNSILAAQASPEVGRSATALRSTITTAGHQIRLGGQLQVLVKVH
jgi:hypothetical protein